MTVQPPAVFIGLDVGKAEHHAVALTAAGKKVYDKALPNDETRLRGILDELARAHGPALLVVDQPATIGALPVAVAQADADGGVPPDAEDRAASIVADVLAALDGEG